MSAGQFAPAPSLIFRCGRFLPSAGRRHPAPGHFGPLLFGRVAAPGREPGRMGTCPWRPTTTRA